MCAAHISLIDVHDLYWRLQIYLCWKDLQDKGIKALVVENVKDLVWILNLRLSICIDGRVGNSSVERQYVLKDHSALPSYSRTHDALPFLREPPTQDPLQIQELQTGEAYGRFKNCARTTRI